MLARSFLSKLLNFSKSSRIVFVLLTTYCGTSYVLDDTIAQKQPINENGVVVQFVRQVKKTQKSFKRRKLVVSQSAQSNNFETRASSPNPVSTQQLVSGPVPFTRCPSWPG